MSISHLAWDTFKMKSHFILVTVLTAVVLLAALRSEASVSQLYSLAVNNIITIKLPNYLFTD